MAAARALGYSENRFDAKDPGRLCRGRERWNHLNPMPIKHIHDRWIGPHAASATARPPVTVTTTAPLAVRGQAGALARAAVGGRSGRRRG